MRAGGGVAVICVFLAFLAVGQQAQRHEEHARHPPQAGATAQAGPASCQDMMARRQKMIARMQQIDEQLQIKLQRMNSATGDAKVQALADVINEMAAQRREMHRNMTAMHEAMMSHMAGHMRQDGMRSAADCPMMQDAPGQ